MQLKLAEPYQSEGDVTFDVSWISNTGKLPELGRRWPTDHAARAR